MDIRAGDTVRVHIKIEEKGKTRIQKFEGLVLAVKHGREAGATFTVRKISNGVGVERIFPIYSPIIDKIEVIKRSQVRRSKLYYIRDKVARDIRRKMRNFVTYFSSTEELEAAQNEAIAETPDVEEVPETTEEISEATPVEAKEAINEAAPVEENKEA